jgi:hypothetical protein
MKIKFLSLLLVTILACNDKTGPRDKGSVIKQTEDFQEVRKDTSMSHFKAFANKFELVNNDFAANINDSLSFYDVNFLVGPLTSCDSNKLKVINVLLLKLYLQHLRSANQGYDLHSERKGDAALLIDFFIRCNNLPVKSEFLNSATPYELIKRNFSVYNNDKEITNLIHLIEQEDQRILSGKPWKK